MSSTENTENHASQHRTVWALAQKIRSTVKPNIDTRSTPPSARGPTRVQAIAVRTRVSRRDAAGVWTTQESTALAAIQPFASTLYTGHCRALPNNFGPSLHLPAPPYRPTPAYVFTASFDDVWGTNRPRMPSSVLCFGRSVRRPGCR